MALPGGPIDGSVLYQQQTHISAFITATNLDNTLRVRRSDNLIWEMWNTDVLHNRVRACLQEMGFYGVLCCGYCVYDSHLITALVERWRRETHTFHLRVGEATITLQDVGLIWGLTVDGDPITGIDISAKVPLWQRYCGQWLGFVPLQADFRGNSIKMSTLHEHCTQTIINENSTEIEVQQYSRCVALMIIGGCLLPDSEGCAVKLLYMNFLEDVTKVRSYSWASAVLAYLYHELCAASAAGKQEIAGPLYILQIWAWSRMTPLCPDRLGYNLIAPPENPNNPDNILVIPPYGARWKHQFCWTHTPTHSVRIIRDVLDRMEDGQFKWVVYDLEAPDVSSLPLQCRHPTLCRSVCPLISFHIVEMHRPNRVLRQFGMSQDIPSPALDGDKLHEFSRRGRKNFDWGKHHRSLVDAWENRHNLIVESDYVVNFSMRHHYETWYDSITRRFISPIQPEQMDYGYHPGDAYFRRIVRDETANLRNMMRGISFDDEPREALAEYLKNTMGTVDYLYEMTYRAPEQQHYQDRSANRRRRQRVDDVADVHSFQTPEWRQSTSRQSPQTSVGPQTADAAGDGTEASANLFVPSPGLYGVPSSYVTWPQAPDCFHVTSGEGTSHTQPEVHTPHQPYQSSFYEPLFGEHPSHNEEMPPSQVLPNPDMILGSNVGVNVNAGREEEEDREAPPLPRRSRRVPHAPDCGTGHRLRRK